MVTARRVGAETSKTRDHLLDCVERLMRDEGYAAVTYRAVAAQAGVTSGSVQYYFPRLDDVFVAAIRRRSEQNVARLIQALSASEHPLRVLWEFSRDDATAALTTEFLALGNHRKSIGAVIAEVTEQVRRLQIKTVRELFKGKDVTISGLSPEALLFLLTGVPRLVRLEQGVGVSTSHSQVVNAFEQYLDVVEPRPKRRSRSLRVR